MADFKERYKWLIDEFREDLPALLEGNGKQCEGGIYCSSSTVTPGQRQSLAIGSDGSGER